MRTEAIEIYKFSELSESAQEKAIETYKQRFYKYGYNWAEEGHQSLIKFCEKFGLKWISSNFSTYSEADVRCEDNDQYHLSGLRARTYFINNFYDVLFTPKPYGEYKKTGNKWRCKRYSKVFFQATSCPFTGYCMDDAILQPLREFIKKPTGETVEDVLYNCVRAWITAASEDCKSQESREFIIDEIEANELEFLASGETY